MRFLYCAAPRLTLEKLCSQAASPLHLYPASPRGLGPSAQCTLSLPVLHYFEKPSCFSLSPPCQPHRILHQLRGQLTNCSHCHVSEACQPRQKLRKITAKCTLQTSELRGCWGGYTASSIKSMLPDPLKNAIIQEESNPTEH